MKMEEIVFENLRGLDGKVVTLEVDRNTFLSPAFKEGLHHASASAKRDAKKNERSSKSLSQPHCVTTKAQHTTL